MIVVCADTRFMKAYPKIGYREHIFNVSVGVSYTRGAGIVIFISVRDF